MKCPYGTPLHFAASLGRAHCLKELFRAGAQSYSVPHKPKSIPLPTTSPMRSESVEQKIIDGIASAHKPGQTPLHCAAMACSSECVQVLLENNVSVHDQDDDGNTPLHVVNILACSAVPVCRLLSKNGARWTTLNRYGCTPLMGLISSYDSTSYVESNDWILPLLELGAVATGRDCKGRTMLHMLTNYFFGGRKATISYNQLIQKLVEVGVDPNIMDDSLKTPLYYALARPHHRMVEALLNAGADVNLWYDCDTALHCLLGFLRNADTLSRHVKRLLQEGDAALGDSRWTTYVRSSTVHNNQELERCLKCFSETCFRLPSPDKIKAVRGRISQLCVSLNLLTRGFEKAGRQGEVCKYAYLTSPYFLSNIIMSEKNLRQDVIYMFLDELRKGNSNLRTVPVLVEIRPYVVDYLVKRQFEDAQDIWSLSSANRTLLHKYFGDHHTRKQRWRIHCAGAIENLLTTLQQE